MMSGVVAVDELWPGCLHLCPSLPAHEPLCHPTEQDCDFAFGIFMRHCISSLCFDVHHAVLSLDTIVQ